MDYEIIIPTATKDHNKVPYILKSIEEHLYPKPVGVNIVYAGEFTQEVKCCPFDRLSIIPEKNVLDLDPTLAKNFRRPQWIYQQFLKLFQNFTETDYYLVIDSDCILNKDIHLFSDNLGTPKFFLGLDQNHQPYFNFMKTMMGIGREYPYSFISEIMMFSTNVINSMIMEIISHTIEEDVDLETVIENREKIVKVIYNITCGRACEDWIPADYEIYGNFVEKFYPHLYTKTNIKTNLRGKYQDWTNEELESYIKEMKELNIHDIFTAHTWI